MSDSVESLLCPPHERRLRLNVRGEWETLISRDVLTQSRDAPASLLPKLVDLATPGSDNTEATLFLDCDVSAMQRVVAWLRDGVVPRLTSEGNAHVRERDECLIKLARELSLGRLSTVLAQQRNGTAENVALQRHLLDEAFAAVDLVRMSETARERERTQFDDESLDALELHRFTQAELQSFLAATKGSGNLALPAANLSGLSFAGMTLPGAQLSGAQLFGCSLVGTNLKGADLQRADLRRSVMIKTNIQGANMTGAKLGDAVLPKDLSQIDFTGATGLSNRDLRGFNLKHSILRAICLDGVLFPRTMNDVRLENVDLEGLDFGGLTLAKASFNFSNLTRTNFAGADLTSATFDGALLDRTNFSGAKLRRADLEGQDLRTCNLREASLLATNMSGSRLNGMEGQLDEAVFGAHTILRNAIVSVHFGRIASPIDFGVIIDFAGADLTGSTSFSKLQLSSCILRETNLEGVDLREAKVAKADFTFANLRNARLPLDAYVKSANFDGANLCGVSFAKFDLSGLQAPGATIDETTDLTGCKFANARLSGWNLSGRDLGKIDLSGANLSRADLSDCDTSKCVFSSITNFTECNLSNCVIKSNVSDAYFDEANLSGADLSESIVIGSSFNSATFTPDTRLPKDLTRCRFESVSLADQDFTGATFDRALFTEGTTFANARLDKASMLHCVLTSAFRNVVTREVGLSLTNANCVYCEIQGVDFTNFEIAGTNFTSAKMQNCVIKNKNLSRCIFNTTTLQGCDLSGSNFSESRITVSTVFKDANISGCTFDGLDLSTRSFDLADLTGCSFVGCDLRKCTFKSAQIENTTFADAKKECPSCARDVKLSADGKCTYVFCKRPLIVT